MRSRLSSPASRKPVGDDPEAARREALAILEQIRKDPRHDSPALTPAERRRGRKLAMLERRKGPLWLYGQIALCVVLFGYLGCSLVK
ncbi:MAG: hypothetical protein IPP07_22905 [Holophagales bacterium]|jgi:hypothetical protein|nr:hypothetical protein [Holophagales bacterium]MBK9967566.1 hypothetical protein [Holophagales bacterium]